MWLSAHQPYSDIGNGENGLYLVQKTANDPRYYIDWLKHCFNFPSWTDTPRGGYYQVMFTSCDVTL